MNLKQSQRAMLLVIALLLFIPIGVLQNTIDPQKPQFQPGAGNAPKAARFCRSNWPWAGWSASARPLRACSGSAPTSFSTAATMTPSRR